MIKFRRVPFYKDVLHLRVMQIMTSCASNKPNKPNDSVTPVSVIDHNRHLSVFKECNPHKRTGIICTIGPATEPKLVDIMRAGMGIARLNFSHGTYEYYTGLIKKLREAEQNYNEILGVPYSLGIALDTKGPEIRTGLLSGGATAEVELTKGAKIILTTDKSHYEHGTPEKVYIDYVNITKVLKKGDLIYVDDGLMSLLVDDIAGDSLTCTVENGGMLGSRKGCNLPGIPVDLPAVSEKDTNDLKFGVEQNVDMVFASFIRNAEAVKEIRSILGEKGKKIKIIPKIENHQGLENIDSIIEAADGIMIARGDLGIEIPPEKVFLAQKMIFAKCNIAGKPCICATQMLDSMTKKPRATRAESNDVANAVLDGADCVMLSGESAKGEYPIETVTTMNRICREVETQLWTQRIYNEITNEFILRVPLDPTHSIAIAAVEASNKCRAAAMIVLTTSGRSAHLLSKYRPNCPIIAVTRNDQVARQAHLYRAVYPLLYCDPPKAEWSDDVHCRINFGVQFGICQEIIKPKDLLVIVTSFKQESSHTNNIRIITVGEDT